MRSNIAILLQAAILLGVASPAAQAVGFNAQRQRMGQQEIVAAGINDPRVIESMRNTPRHEFVALPSRANAYYDMALPIGNAQTISPTFVVAYLTPQIQPQT